ncbi:alpha/beta fold hydrolase [Micromonospora sp. WMMD1082]|uniref:alpha/beta hydrolase family protein n=1 Tax=Micromonospora sp. WMMD1082 TaxID=3016104 RepID=UPI0024169510|nr:alpha/beta fold hydrolase [Micromonospora sp. WMMD1082]MDG4794747.1 alpha/beta fold hydrolase [Micromonospora sp. WMMD1082]
MLFAPVSTELSFAHGGNTLAGDLVRPPWPGPHPAVVFVEGSGPGGRDLGSWPTRLAAAGFASLAYDKPGSGASTGDWTRQTLADRARETMAAVRAVRHRDDIRPDAVALVGGSQGGWVAPLAAALDDTIAAVVTVSGPGVGVLAQEEHRLRHQLPAEGFTDADAEQAVALLRDQIRRIRAGDNPVRVHAAQARWRTAGWYPLLAGTTPESIAFLAGIADHDPTQALAALRCPLLAVFGADDVLVPVAESVRAITGILRDAGHGDHQIVVFPHADHGIRVPAGDGPATLSHGRYTAGVRAPGFDEMLVTWLQRRLDMA